MSRRCDQELRPSPTGPPRDDSMTFAAVGIALTAVAWFVTPAVGAAVFSLTR